MSQGSAISLHSATARGPARRPAGTRRAGRTRSSPRPSARGEVEAEPVDVHLLAPVAQASMTSRRPVGRSRVERVAAAGDVDVAPPVVVEAVVGRVVEPAEAERRPVGAALGGVVEDDVEDHLEARRVQRLHHPLELDDLRPVVARGRVLGVRARRSRSTGSPSSCAGRAPRAHSSCTNWCTGISSTAVTPRSTQMLDRRRVGEAGVGAAQRPRARRGAAG